MLQTTVKTRCIIGILQGIMLYLLYLALSHNVWPATETMVFKPLLTVFLFIPIVINLSINHLRRKTLLTWSIIITFLLLVFGFYNAWQNGSPAWNNYGLFSSDMGLFNIFIITGLFIAQTLIVSGDNDRSVMAKYPTYFNASWKLCLQIILSVVFLGVFWCLLYAAAGLFSIIKLDFFNDLIQKKWFSIPVSAVVFNLGLHITDVKVSIIKGVRTLMLTLMSWLLPVLTICVSAFLIGLLFTGLAPLWASEFTPLLLSGTAAALIIFINATWQDGVKLSRFMSWVCSIAAIILLLLCALAVAAVIREVHHNGWTYPYVLLAAALLIITFYAVGYVLFSFRLKGIEKWNFYAALLVLCVLISLLTPTLDPARLSVNSQTTRLKSGKITAAKFDFDFLRWQAGRYGNEALIDLKTHSQDAWIRKRATAVLNEPQRYVKKDARTLIIAHTADGQLPASFMQQQWKDAEYNYNLPNCLIYGTRTCEAWKQNIQGKNIILMLDANLLSVFSEVNPQHWEYLGNYKWPDECQTVSNAAAQGLFTLLPPENPFPELDIMGSKFHFNPLNPHCDKNKL